MEIYIDESGAFTWGKRPDISLFCGVTVANRDSDAVFARFVGWKRAIVGDSKREIKGAELTDAQLEQFANNVLGTQGRDFWLTVVGLDTTRTKREHIEELRRQAWVMAERSSELAAEHSNTWLTEFYRQQTGWLKARSAENMLWIVGLEHTIMDSLQHSIMRFMEPEDDAEYLPINVLIDRSFIQREQHINFWREWLASCAPTPAATQNCRQPCSNSKVHRPAAQARRGRAAARAEFLLLRPRCSMDSPSSEGCLWVAAFA